MKDRYITAYGVTRHYGGPEEGGWWYDHYTPIETVAVPKVFQRKYKRARNRVERLRDMLQEAHADRAWGNRYHTTGGVAVITLTESIRRENQTKYKPCYC